MQQLIIQGTSIWYEIFCLHPSSAVSNLSGLTSSVRGTEPVHRLDKAHRLAPFTRSRIELALTLHAGPAADQPYKLDPKCGASQWGQSRLFPDLAHRASLVPRAGCNTYQLGSVYHMHSVGKGSGLCCMQHTGPVQDLQATLWFISLTLLP